MKLLRLELIGYDANNNEVCCLWCRVKNMEDKWILPKNAKRKLREIGAISFKRRKILEE